MATQPTPQPPVVPPAGDPNAQYGPAPAEQATPYQQQPVNQQYFAQPQAAPVQYVVMAESLKGVRGWLLFFTICFGFAGLVYIATFFSAMKDLGAADNIISLIFAPILAAISVAATVTIAMEKRIGKWLGAGVYAGSAIYSVFSSIIAFAKSGGDDTIGLFSGIIVGIASSSLFALYFFVSKRVKETLVK